MSVKGNVKVVMTGNEQMFGKFIFPCSSYISESFLEMYGFLIIHVEADDVSIFHGLKQFINNNQSLHWILKLILVTDIEYWLYM